MPAETSTPISDFDELAARAASLIVPGERRILGITGSPGAGKTTLAGRIVKRLNDSGAHVGYLPMDGFHLANSKLDRRRIRDRKGAVDTFDGWGFVGLLRRILVETDHPVYAPSFERTIDEPIAGEIEIPSRTTLVVVEGNYLLLDAEPWSQIPGLLAQTWFCATPESDRLDRLIDRHIRHGRSPEAARTWARTVDGTNAVLIEQTRTRADLVVSGSL
ncbi:nucleoside/nucleotide kinase family protein [Gordonia sp. TBRC 11910]|uniref:Nucleoside/nucleotide kinase family protein n=1 Tax=Gordonia asplenii TaxID=2725283 RepID=A0A848KP04_9ACTN|nr:nucleoside/nucleotide kinase family protein [Gordonia asplenii]NMN99626.1 nucleoside/nucleotide kinase family protein [Gordonia asplenii]